MQKLYVIPKSRTGVAIIDVAFFEDCPTFLDTLIDIVITDITVRNSAEVWSVQEDVIGLEGKEVERRALLALSKLKDGGVCVPQRYQRKPNQTHDLANAAFVIDGFRNLGKVYPNNYFVNDQNFIYVDGIQMRVNL